MGDLYQRERRTILFFGRARFWRNTRSFLAKRRDLPTICRCGAATQKALEEEDLHAAYAAANIRRDRPRRWLPNWASGFAGKHVLVPRSDIANGELLAALRKAGATVTAVEAYQRRRHNRWTARPCKCCNAIKWMQNVFSPSAFHNFARFLDAGGLGRVAGPRGLRRHWPTTAMAIRNAGIAVPWRPRSRAPTHWLRRLEQIFPMRETQKGSD